MNYKNTFNEHKSKISDKWDSYLKIYDQIFSGWVNEPISILEIGVQNGGSLEILGKYFSNAKNIIGIDINEKCAGLDFDDHRIKVIIGSAAEQSVLMSANEISNGLSIIIDDGSHKSSDIIKSFVFAMSVIQDKGVYVAEDLHCSYWDDYEGGLTYKHSAIEFFKAIIDYVNIEHCMAGESTVVDRIMETLVHYGIDFDISLLSYVKSISFSNSICWIDVDKQNKNTLGNRLVAGKIELVTEGFIS